MTPWAYAVRHWQFTLVIFIFFLALGLYALQNIPRQEDPSFAIPITSIIVNFPGADPEDVERLAVDPIEDTLAELDDIKEIRSTSEDGLAVIRIEFDWSVDADKKYDEVVREIGRIRPDLPEEIGELTFRKTNPGLVNIIQLALVSRSVDAIELKKTTERLEERLEAVAGIRRAESWAFPDPEIRIALDLPRLVMLGLDVDAVISAVEGQGQVVPGGAVDVDTRRFNLKTSGDYKSLQEIARTVVSSDEGRIVHVEDIAEVRWATEEQRYLGRYNGERAAFVTANMKDGENIFVVQAELDKVLAEFSSSLPSSIRLETGFQQSRNVADRLSRLSFDFVLALSLVAITLLPLGLRAAGIVMVAIPLSLTMGLAGLWFLGHSLNQLSIAGFVVALGLLVDDAIVVVENIARRLRDGLERTEAALVATNQIAVAVLGCTATLILAFVPLLNLPEGAGKFTLSLPLAVVLTVLSSLIVAFTIIPFLASRLLSKHSPPEGNVFLRLLKRGIHRFYAPLVRVSLRSPKTALTICFTLFASSLLLVPSIGFSLFPASDKPQFLVTIKTPEGASLDATDKALQFVEAELARHEVIEHVLSNLGQGNPYVYYNVFPLENKANTAEVLVGLDRWDPQHSPAFIEKLRKRFAMYPEAQIIARRFENGPPIEAPIAVRIMGPELDVLQQIASQAETALKLTAGARDVSNPMRLPRIDYDLGFDLDKAAFLGIQSLDIDRSVRLAVTGYQAGVYRDDTGDEYPITLRLPIKERPTLALLQDLRFSSMATGEAVPLNQIAQPYLVSGPIRIERFNRARMVTVTAFVQDGFITSEVSSRIYEALSRIPLPAGYRIEAGGEAQAASQSLSGLGTAMLLSAFGILAVLVLEFGSFRSMMIVAGVIPFGVAGALVALFVTGYSLSYMAIIGFVALVGVEIKNSILMVDFTNQLRHEGTPLNEAIEQAGELRFLPVLLTSATAIGGLTPLAIAGSALYSPLAIVMIGGLISSTLLARIVTPVMYKLFPPTINGHATEFLPDPLNNTYRSTS
ncbi:efflux RND transporter permease subunit [Allohahella sp. A8]|uniref:efflux RND transporter permease subunit n=1 Tax=Allohahella sp. A8 TaxID=3141461 RepID=UPI003A80C68D